MIGKPLPREELFTVHISHIPAFILPSPFKHLGFYVGGKLWLCVYFRQDFSVGSLHSYLSISFIHLLQNRSVAERRGGKWIFRETSATRTAQEVGTMRRGKQSNVFSALIRRETNCPRTNDHNLLLSYAEDSSVMSCYRTEVGFLPLSFYRSMYISIWCYCCCLVIDLLQIFVEDCVTLSN